MGTLLQFLLRPASLEKRDSASDFEPREKVTGLWKKHYEGYARWRWKQMQEREHQKHEKDTAGSP